MKIFRNYQAIGYEITHKRILGNPKITPKETREKDLCQEIALLRRWLLEKSIWVNVHKATNRKFYWTIEDELSPHPPQFFEDMNSAYLSAFEYIIQNKMLK